MDSLEGLVKSLDWESRESRQVGQRQPSTLSSWLRRVIGPGLSSDSWKFNIPNKLCLSDFGVDTRSDGHYRRRSRAIEKPIPREIYRESMEVATKCTEEDTRRKGAHLGEEWNKERIGKAFLAWLSSRPFLATSRKTYCR